jgi:hypothetical protein
MIDFQQLERKMVEGKIPPFADDRYMIQVSRKDAIESQLIVDPQQIPSKLLGRRLTRMVSQGELIYAGVQKDFHIFIVD